MSFSANGGALRGSSSSSISPWRLSLISQDLKKQTALRLAHEQHKQAPDSGGNFFVAPKPPQQTEYRGVPIVEPTKGTGKQQQPSVTPMNPPYNQSYHGQNPSFLPVPVAPSPPAHYNSERSIMRRNPPPRSYSPSPTVLPTSSTESISKPPQIQRDLSRDSNSSKLPHGLTVQELKEMTKARLRFEQREQPLNHHATSSIIMSPLPLIPTRSRTHSRDNWSEADEFGSVCSVTSEYRPEPVLVAPSYRGDNNASPYAPSRSHLNSYGETLENGLPESVAFVHPSQGDAYFNRRRAQTLSPRQGLSHLDEERQVLSTHGQPNFRGLPLLSTPPNRHYPRYSNNSNHNNNNVDVFGLEHGNRQRTFSLEPTSLRANMDLEANRQRTHSAASLPPISHTADEFSQRLPTGIGMVRKDAPSPSVTGLATHVFGSPPGFVSPVNDPLMPTCLGNSLHSSYDGGGGDVRHRASTWAPDSMFASSDLGGGYSLDDLASILKLSGAEGKGQ